MSIKRGDKVKFYDAQMATQDKDWSGADEKYYPIGIVEKVYIFKSSFGGGWEDEVCDINVSGRISKGHFTSGVEKQD